LSGFRVKQEHIGWYSVEGSRNRQLAKHDEGRRASTPGEKRHSKRTARRGTREIGSVHTKCCWGTRRDKFTMSEDTTRELGKARIRKKTAKKKTKKKWDKSKRKKRKQSRQRN